ncbi:hypothetical protein BJ508DRAFT_316407, partial [Ascobolus immersus RN42]
MPRRTNEAPVHLCHQNLSDVESLDGRKYVLDTHTSEDGSDRSVRRKEKKKRVYPKRTGRKRKRRRRSEEREAEEGDGDDEQDQEAGNDEAMGGHNGDDFGAVPRFVASALFQFFPLLTHLLWRDNRRARYRPPTVDEDDEDATFHREQPRPSHLPEERRQSRQGPEPQQLRSDEVTADELMADEVLYRAVMPFFPEEARGNAKVPHGSEEDIRMPDAPRSHFRVPSSTRQPSHRVSTPPTGTPHRILRQRSRREFKAPSTQASSESESIVPLERHAGIEANNPSQPQGKGQPVQHDEGHYPHATTSRQFEEPRLQQKQDYRSSPTPPAPPPPPPH